MASTTYDDYELIVMLAADSAGCTLAKTPQKDNWVDKAGHLPPYICAIARAVARGGKPVSSSIAIAVSRAKAWASGRGKVDADTRAKAAAAVAQWEALKAKSRAGKLVKASRLDGDELVDYIMLSNIPSFNMATVTSAFEARNRAARQAAMAQARQDNPYGDPYALADSSYPYAWVKEVWTDYIIVQSDDRDGMELMKIPYTVDSTSKEVSFGDPVEVQQAYVEVEDPDLTDDEKELLGLTQEDENDVRLTAFLKDQEPLTPLDRILSLHRPKV